MWGWRDGWEISSTHCSCGGCKFSSQHPHWASLSVHSSLSCVVFRCILCLWRINPQCLQSLPLSSGWLMFSSETNSESFIAGLTRMEPPNGGAVHCRLDQDGAPNGGAVRGLPSSVLVVWDLALQFPPGWDHGLDSPHICACGFEMGSWDRPDWAWTLNAPASLTFLRTRLQVWATTPNFLLFLFAYSCWSFLMFPSLTLGCPHLQFLFS